MLAFAPIPPVRVFGVFVATGIALAFYLTITFIPAYVVRMREDRIATLGSRGWHDRHWVARLLTALGPRTLARSRAITIAAGVVLAVSAFGILRIRINDNPVRWFRPSHRIRVADRVLNKHFGGTYNAFLTLERAGDAGRAAVIEDSISAVLDTLDTAPADEIAHWETVLARLERAEGASKYFQTPGALARIEGLQRALAETGLVGKSTSVADIVKTVHRELRGGGAAEYRVPERADGVAQTLLPYQSSHRPHALWHFVTPDLRRANIWLQLKSGDNQDMARVSAAVDDYLAAHPLPDGVTAGWAGLTHLNVVWQQNMVSGMRNALLGSFVIVFVMMLVLFRSLWFGLLAMLPLSVTIAFIYGLVGLAGKDYDMLIAVLSSLTLGLSVDFAIHFLQRAREVHCETGEWHRTVAEMFSEPARAISRNAIVIAIGFLPLLASPLVPYNTVGIFLALIMIVSCAVTLVLLPAVMNFFPDRLFGGTAAGGPDESPAPGSGGTRRIGRLGRVVSALRLMSSRASKGQSAPRKSPPGPAQPGLSLPAKHTAMAALALALVAAVPGARAETPADADAIVARANLAAYYAGADGRARVRMTITDGQGRRRIRQFTILRRDDEDGGDQRYAVLFSRPADVRNTVFIVHKHAGGDDDRWLYLPALDLVKRIAAGDKRTSFVGSHFYYEDISGRGTEDDTHELVETTDTQFVIRNTPKDPGAVEFTSYTVWIDKKSFLPAKMEYTNAAGEVYRRIEALAVEDVQGYPTVTRMKVSDLAGGGFTVAEFRNVQYDLGIPPDVFTERTLRNPSRQWFRGR